jgi:hypothetical protein
MLTILSYMVNNGLTLLVLGCRFWVSVLNLSVP